MPADIKTKFDKQPFEGPYEYVCLNKPKDADEDSDEDEYDSEDEPEDEEEAADQGTLHIWLETCMFSLTSKQNHKRNVKRPKIQQTMRKTSLQIQKTSMESQQQTTQPGNGFS